MSFSQENDGGIVKKFEGDFMFRSLTDISFSKKVEKKSGKTPGEGFPHIQCRH